MANIVWSFGVALTAEDKASEPVSKVTTKIDDLTKSLDNFNESQVETTQNLGAMRRSVLDLMDAFNGIDNVRSNVDSDTTSMVDGFGRVGNAATEAGESVSLLGLALGGIAGLAVSAAEKVVTSFISVGKSIAVNSVKAMWFLVKSSPAILAFAVKSALTAVNLAATVVLGGIPILLGLATIAAKKLIDSLMDVPDIISRWVLGKSVETLIRDLEDANTAANNFLQLGEGFYEFSGGVDRLAASLGGTSKQANALKDDLIQVAKATGTTKEQTLALASALSNYGQTLEDIRKGGIGKEQLQSISELITKYKLTTEVAAKLAADTKSLSITTEDFLKISQEAASKYGLTDTLNETAGVIGTATEMYRTFGKQIAGNSKEIVRNITDSAARISKSLNIDVGQAFGRATEFSKKFAAAQLQNKRAMLGLGDFNELTYTLAQTGMGIKQITDLIKTSKDSPIEFANSVNKMADTMAKRFGDPRVGERFREQIIQQMQGTGVDELLRDPIALEKANQQYIEQQKNAQSAAAQGIVAFKDLYNNASDFLLNSFSNVAKAFYDTIGLIFSDDIMKGPLQDLNKILKDTSKTFDTFVKDLASTEDFKDFTKGIRSIITTLVAMGTGGKLAAQGLTGLTLVTGLLKPLSVGLEIIAGSLGVISTSTGLIKLASKTLVAVSAVGGLKKGFTEIKEIIEDPNKSGIEKFVQSTKIGFREIYGYASTIVSTIYTELFPEGIKKGLNKAQDYIKEEAPKIYNSVKSGITEILEGFGVDTEKLGLQVSLLISNIKIGFLSAKEIILNAFESVGQVIGPIAGMMLELVRFKQLNDLGKIQDQMQAQQDNFKNRKFEFNDADSIKIREKILNEQLDIGKKKQSDILDRVNRTDNAIKFADNLGMRSQTERDSASMAISNEEGKAADYQRKISNMNAVNAPMTKDNVDMNALAFQALLTQLKNLSIINNQKFEIKTTDNTGVQITQSIN